MFSAQLRLIASLLVLLCLSSSLPGARAQLSVASTGACAYFNPGQLLRGSNNLVTVVAAASAVDTAVGQICICEQANAINTDSAARVRSKIVVGGTVGNTLGTLEGLLGLTPDQTVTAIDNAALVTLKGNTQCTYPAFSIPACATGCSFTCVAGYTLCGAVCVAGTTCPATTASTSTASSTATPTVNMGRRRLPPPNQMCPGGYSACRLGGGTGGGVATALNEASGSLTKRGYECVKVEEDIEQCGGCMFPTAGDERVGVDCTALTPFANAVSCRNGTCQIDSCAREYTLQGNECVKTSRYGLYSQPGGTR